MRVKQNCKQIKILVLTLSLFIATACSKINDSTQSDNNSILLTWNLIRYEGGFSPTSNYTNEIQWTFNPNNTIDVVIESGTTINNNLILNSKGTYSYLINADEITIEGVNYNYEVSDNELIIAELIGQAADGMKLTFNKL